MRVSFFCDFIFDELKDLCCPAPVKHIPELVWYSKITGPVTRRTQVTV